MIELRFKSQTTARKTTVKSLPFWDQDVNERLIQEYEEIETSLIQDLFDTGSKVLSKEPIDMSTEWMDLPRENRQTTIGAKYY